MFIELILLVIPCLLLYDYLKKKRCNDTLSYIPGPSPLPIIGNILLFCMKSEEEMYQHFFLQREKYGPIYKTWIFNMFSMTCSDPKVIKVILTSQTHITKTSGYKLIIDWLGTGLLISTGPKWHSRRKVITPTFHFKVLEQFVEIFDNQSREMMSLLKDKADGKTAVNIYPYFCNMALDIITETAMGVKINAQKNPNVGYAKAVQRITHIVSRRIASAWQRFTIPFMLFAPLRYKKFKELLKELHAFTDNVIQERRATLEKETPEAIDQVLDEGTNIKKRMMLLDVLLKSEINGKPLSNEDIREEVDTFMFEGHDTTTTALSFIIYLLSRHPESQMKAFNEVREVFGDDVSRPVTMHDLNDLKYLECVIKEGLRLYPPVPMFGRRFTEPLEIDGITIPTGCEFVVPIYVMLRDPDYFPNPNDFIPDRFMDDNHEKINPFAYVPFSAGPRNCIGQKFAMLELKCGISKILRTYELLPLGPEIKPVINLVMRSLNGMHIGLKPRVY